MVQELQEPGEFLSTLKVDLAPVEVYAFTPKGRVLELPRGATPVDFAYMVHTEVGHQCVGAKVNGQMVSLRHEITSGDVVEILTQKGHKPSRDWLSFVKSSSAKSKIRHWINEQEREEATEMASACSRMKLAISAAASRKFPNPTCSNSSRTMDSPKWRICTPPSVSENIPRARFSLAFWANPRKPQS